MKNQDERFVAAIDQGTSGTRCVVFDQNGAVKSYAYAAHTQIYPKPGWVEHDPIEIWKKTKAVIRKALKKALLEPKQIAAVGITNQRETAMLWDAKTGRPLYNAIVWQDTRTGDLCERLKDENEDIIRRKTGLPLSSYFSSTKLQWMLNHLPGARERADKGEILFGNVDTWLIWNLMQRKNGSAGTPAHVTDYTNASRTMLMDIEKLSWSGDLLELFKIPETILPEIRPSSDRNIYGYTAIDGPFTYEIPICGDLGDQQSSLFGHLCFESGETKNTYGSGSFLLQNTGASLIFSRHGLVTTVAYGLEEKKVSYALEGSIAVTGMAVRWLEENLGVIGGPTDVERLAKSVSKVGSAGVYFVPAFTGLYAPYWDRKARGLIIGLTQYTRAEHIVHAALEAICYQTRDVFESMQEDTGMRIRSLKVDGGATVNDYLMQLQADVLGRVIIRPKIREMTAAGAAYAAGLAIGVWRGTADIRKLWRKDRTFEPRWDEDKREGKYTGWRRAVERAKGWMTQDAH